MKSDNGSFLPWTAVKLQDGFWGAWQRAAAEKTSKAIYRRFDETGRINAMRLEWKEGMPNKPHVFWDSDVAKWMEGTAYLLHYSPSGELAGLLDAIIGRIEKGQTQDGYFNSAFLTVYPGVRFADRTDHELYTAGHLIEAAVAHYQATGSGRFLDLMKRFADCIEQAFVVKHTAYFKTPGHQELELALIRLWQATGEERYLNLAKHFVDTRGTDPDERVFSVPNGTPPASPPLHNQLQYNDTYAQDDAPAKELTAAGGHAVRAMYYYTAMADLARIFGDEELLAACKRLWNDSALKKMYVTGGISAERYGEAIGMEYVLPNDYAYAETCASVAMANFSQRMFLLEHDGKYADMIERQMYNGALSGLSIDGEAFYYDNALLSRPAVNRFFAGIHALPLLPAAQRQKLFECSCCPPNIYRFIAALGQYFYSCSPEENTLFVHQYAGGTASAEIAGKKVTFTQVTDYPWDGHFELHLSMDAPVDFTLAVRIPGWCENASVRRNGIPADSEGMLPAADDIRMGYLYLPGTWKDGDSILLDFPMPVTLLEGNPRIVEAAGKVTLARGPVIYCVEGKDNAFNIFDLTLSADGAYQCKKVEIAGLPIVSIQGEGTVSSAEAWENTLYRVYKPDKKAVRFTAIPYFAWANRGENDMTVWLKRQD